MKCSNCSAEGGSGKFCRECGSPLTEPQKPTCSSCGAELLPSARFCAKCGKKTGVPAAAAPSSEPKCPQCGTRVHSGMKFCKACGAPLSTAAPALASMEPALVEPAPLHFEPASPSEIATSPSTTPAPIPVIRPPSPAPRVASAPAIDDESHPPDAFPAEPAMSGRKPALIAGVLLAALIGSAVWGFAIRKPPVNNAPIVKGPLYDQPAR